MIKQNDVERQETARYVATLEKELSGLKNQTTNQEVRLDGIRGLLSGPVLEVINEVTETCLTTDKDD